MWNDRHITIAAACLVAGALVLVGLFIWPNYRRASQVRGQIADLQAKMDGLEGRNNEVEQLAAQLRALQSQVETELKEIPWTPDVASLYRKLSQEVDGSIVLDQTFTKGSVSELAVTIGDGSAAVQPDGAKAATSSLQAMAITVDMEATFDSVFAMVRSAELMRQLVRVSSVRLQCKRDALGQAAAKTPETSVPDGQAQGTDACIVSATIGLEAIFEPVGDKEDK